MAAYLWPFLRIGACLMVAPIFGARFGMPEASATALFAATLGACATPTALIMLLDRAGLVSVTG